MTGRFVVDTNVLVAANGQDTHADIRCRLRCISELDRLKRQAVICIDAGWLIMGEYQRKITGGGQPGVGTAFFKHLSKGDPERVRVVPVELRNPRDTEGRDFRDPVLPENNLKKDAKFLAVAVKADAEIVNATDSDWVEHRELTDQLGVAVRQLCPQHATRSK